MTGMYEDLSDDDLKAEIIDLRGKIKIVVGGGTAVVVAGEGRRVEYTAANLKGLQSLLTAAIRERDERAGVQISGAIAVTFPYGGDFYG